MSSVRLKHTANRHFRVFLLLAVCAVVVGVALTVQWGVWAIAPTSAMAMWAGAFGGSAQLAYRESRSATEDEINQKLTEEGFK